jgi:hypothetical protein
MVNIFLRKGEEMHTKFWWSMEVLVGGYGKILRTVLMETSNRCPFSIVMPDA